jgi:hypothetical protein
LRPWSQSNILIRELQDSEVQSTGSNLSRTLDLHYYVSGNLEWRTISTNNKTLQFVCDFIDGTFKYAAWNALFLRYTALTFAITIPTHAISYIILLYRPGDLLRTETIYSYTGTSSVHVFLTGKWTQGLYVTVGWDRKKNDEVKVQGISL